MIITISSTVVYLPVVSITANLKQNFSLNFYIF